MLPIRKVITTAIFASVLSLYANAQHVTIDLHAGLSGYQGDLQQSKFNLGDINPAISLGATKYFTPKIGVRGMLTFTKVEGSDRTSDGEVKNERNLSFESKIMELQFTGVYNFINMEVKGWSPYIFAGFAYYNYDPYTYSTSGEKIFLRNLGTEGQFIPGSNIEPYNRNQLAIPFGLGVMAYVSDKFQVGVEFSMRKLFTDYLDDVSGVYADQSALNTASGPVAVQMAYRGWELLNASPYPPAGAQRGNPSNKDWYYTTSLRVSYVLKPMTGSRTWCPTL